MTIIVHAQSFSYHTYSGICTIEVGKPDKCGAVITGLRVEIDNRRKSPSVRYTYDYIDETGRVCNDNVGIYVGDDWTIVPVYEN